MMHFVLLLALSLTVTGLSKRLWHRLISDRACPAVVVGAISDPSSPLIHQLSNDIMKKILGNLCTGDRFRMRLVSKSWRQLLMEDDIPLAPEAPWLIVSDDTYLTPKYFLSEVCFKSLNEERIYRFKLPSNICSEKDVWCCCGSSRGWLLIEVGRYKHLHSTNMFLWNPISGITKQLPPLSTIPCFNQFVDDGIRLGYDNISVLINQFHVFSIGVVECVVAIVLVNPSFIETWRYQQQLALCTPHDQSWSAIGGRSGAKQHVYMDILYHNGKLYASCKLKEGEEQQPLDIDRDKIIREGVYMVHLNGGGGCDVEVNILRFVYENIVDLPFGFSFFERAHVIERLVGSCSSTGEMLVVSCVQDCYARINTDDQDAVAGSMNTFILFQTSGFEVRRVTGDCLEKVRGSIGEQGIFVGSNGTLSLPAYVNGSEADCIYFATDSGAGMVGFNMGDLSNNELHCVREQGVFNLRENRIQITSLAHIRYPSGSSVGWFTPRLF